MEEGNKLFEQLIEKYKKDPKNTITEIIFPETQEEKLERLLKENNYQSIKLVNQTMNGFNVYEVIKQDGTKDCYYEKADFSTTEKYTVKIKTLP